MLNILLVPNIENENAKACADNVFSYLENKANVYYYPQSEDVLKKTDLIIVFGGDGTLLSAASFASAYNIPLLGINLGSLGFLAEIEKHEIAESLDAILCGNYEIENRTMLKAKLVLKNGETKSFDALNDFVVSRGTQGGLVDLELFIKDEPVDDFRADGIIFSTPTGSTAYSLSAGGPLLDPSVDAFLITPVCPHKIYSRAIVTSFSNEILVTPNSKCSENTVLIGDGVLLAPFVCGDKLIITKSELTTKLVRLKKHAFYNTLKNKLMH